MKTKNLIVLLSAIAMFGGTLPAQAISLPGIDFDSIKRGITNFASGDGITVTRVKQDSTFYGSSNTTLAAPEMTAAEKAEKARAAEQARAEREARIRAEADARARAEQDARERADARERRQDEYQSNVQANANANAQANLFGMLLGGAIANAAVSQMGPGVQEHGINFHLGECEPTGKTLTCHLMIQSQNRARDLLLFGDDGDIFSRAIDDQGKETRAFAVTLGSIVDNTYARAQIPGNMPVVARVVFKGVSARADELLLLDLKFKTKGDVFDVRFKNVSLYN